VKTPEAIGTAILARLARQAERNKAAGGTLRAVIRGLLDNMGDGQRLTAQQVLKQLPTEWSWCSLRTVQIHIQRIRADR
jgi:hypothetical protein